MEMNLHLVFQKFTVYIKKIVHFIAITNIDNVKNPLLQGREYKTFYHVIIANSPHFILFKKIMHVSAINHIEIRYKK